MKAIVFGRTGMIGQGVMRELLLDGDVERILTLVREPTGNMNPGIRELVHTDFLDYSAIGDELTGYDACFFCLGTSSVGKSEAEYRRITYDITMAAARALVERNPGMTFVYVSAAGADSSEQGRIMWARVRGKLENDLMKLPFKAVYAFRPAGIQPLHGIEARQQWTRVLYKVLAPALPLLKKLFPSYMTDTEQLARAMIGAAKQGGPSRVVEARDFAMIA